MLEIGSPESCAPDSVLAAECVTGVLGVEQVQILG
jgi:hypothetical protein